MAVNYSKYFPIKDYYERFVIPINPRRFKVVSDKMVCPLHNDHDPSLGIIVKKDKTEICHCFGCNYWGDIIKLHQSISQRLLGKYITPEDSLKELCNIFSVNPESLPVGDLSSIEDKGTRQENELIQAMEDFDIGDFKYMIQRGKREKRGINYFNTITMVMVDKMKES